MKKFFSDFKKFISRGNIMDMAVGVIIASAFSAIVTALTNKIIMPLINWLLSAGGENGLESAYTILKAGYVVDPETGLKTFDLASSIYIDWGAFITAIINFLIIAFVLFTIVRVVMKSQGFLKDVETNYKKSKPTKEEKKILAERGVNLKDKVAVKLALEELRKEEEEKKKAEEAAKPKPETELDLLKEIKELLKEQVKGKQTNNDVNLKSENK